MRLTEDFPISSRLIRKTFRDEQKMSPNSTQNIWKLLARTRPEKPDPIPTVYRPLWEPLIYFIKKLISFKRPHVIDLGYT